MRRHLLLAISPLLLGCGLAAQALTPESFRPESPQAEIRIAFDVLKERGIWEELEHSLLAPMLKMAEANLGFGIGQLDDFRIWIRVPADESGQRQRVKRVFVMSGDIGWPKDTEDWDVSRVGDFEAKSQRESDIMVKIGEGMLVQGSRELIEPMVLGKTRPGLPGAEQMSMLAARHPALLHLYADLVAARQSNGDFGFLTEVDYPEDDPAAHLTIRLAAIGDDEDEQRLELQAMVRHPKGEAGLRVTQQAAKEWIEELESHQQLAGLKHIWSAIEFETKGADLIAKLDLGRPRDAIGKIAQIAVPFFTLQTVGRAEAHKAVKDAEEEFKRALEANAKAKAKAERDRQKADKKK